MLNSDFLKKVLGIVFSPRLLYELKKKKKGCEVINFENQPKPYRSN